MFENEHKSWILLNCQSLGDDLRKIFVKIGNYLEDNHQKKNAESVFEFGMSN